MQGHIHLERIRYPFLYGDKHSRFDILTRFRNLLLLYRIAVHYIRLKLKLISISRILLPIQLLPDNHTTKGFLKCCIFKKLMALPHDVLTGQFVSVDQPDIL